MVASTQPEKFGNRYILLDIIGTGGMAEVFRGKIVGEKGFEKLIVIKKLFPHIARDQRMVAHFTNEARLAALLQHENIAAIYDFGEVDGSFFIVMEYLFGKDLSSISKRLGEHGEQFSPEIALFVLANLCEGMHYAHTLKDLEEKSLNLIHRDLTPQNIFVTYDGNVKILDFGIAKTTLHDNDTKVGVVKGKMNYMSPEQITGEDIDARSDIFSMGILLYEMLSGKSFYTGDTGEIIRKSVKVEFTPLEDLVPGLPDTLYALFYKAIERDVDLRYQSCKEFGHDISRCLADFDCTLNKDVLKGFIQEAFAEDYRQEKEVTKKLLARKPDTSHQVEFDKTIFIDTKQPFDDNNDQRDSMRYAPKNTPKDPLAIKEQQPAEEAVIIRSEPAEPPPSMDNQIKAAKKSESQEPVLTLQQQKNGVSTKKKKITISGKRPDEPGKNYPKIDIATTERPTTTRTGRTGFDRSNLYRSFGPLALFIVVIVAGVGLYLSASYQDQIIDVFEGVVPPEIPQMRTTEMSSSQKELLLFKLALKGESALNDGKLIQPEKENAYVFFHQLRALSPGDKEVESNLLNLSQKLAHTADVAMQNGEKKKAAQLIVAGLSISPDNRKLLRLQDELKQ